MTLHLISNSTVLNIEVYGFLLKICMCSREIWCVFIFWGQQMKNLQTEEPENHSAPVHLWLHQYNICFLAQLFFLPRSFPTVNKITRRFVCRYLIANIRLSTYETFNYLSPLWFTCPHNEDRPVALKSLRCQNSFKMVFGADIWAGHHIN